MASSVGEPSRASRSLPNESICNALSPMDVSADGRRSTDRSRKRCTTSAVVAIPEAFGLNDHIEDVTRRFADAGYVGLGLDIFHRSGKGTAPYGDFSKAMELFERVSDDTLLADVDAAFDHLHSMGIDDDHIGIVGFCFGGRTTFLVAARRAIGAAVGFYGGGIVTARFP